MSNYPLLLLTLYIYSKTVSVNIAGNNNNVTAWLLPPSSWFEENGVQWEFRNLMPYLMVRSVQQMQVRMMCFYGPLTMFTLMFSASVKLLKSSTLSFFSISPSLSLSLFVMYVVCMHACVLTIVWTVLQAKVQRLFLRVRIWTIMSGTQYVCSGGARVWNWP